MLNNNSKLLNKFILPIIIIFAVFNAWIWFSRYQAGHSPYTPEINNVLQQAGDNRSELEKVLKHYSRRPADSLKLRAAEFLIENMQGKHSKYYDAPVESVAAVLLRWTSSSDRRMVMDTYGLGELIVREDVKYITGDYLINNIDLAFKVWEEQPWCKHIPFDVFCEDILPYRVNTEPLENWRAKALAGFAGINNSFKEQPDISAVEACGRVNRLLPGFRMDRDFIPMNYSGLMATTRSTCEGISATAIFAMRALGIPVARDYTPMYPYIDSGHSWNAVRDSSGKYISFMGTETVPGEPHQGTTFIQAKVFRKTFKMQDSIREDISAIPPMYQDNCFKDVSPEYRGFGDIRVPLNSPPPDGASKEYVYLAMLNSDVEWKITGREKPDGTTVLFPGVGIHIIYLPVYYNSGILTPAGNPFRLDTVGIPRFFETGSTQYDTLLLSGIKMHNKIAVNTWAERMLHGVFEAANESDFSDAVRLHAVNTLPDGLNYNRVKLNNTKKFRYIRYLPPPKSYCNVSEIGIYGTDRKKLSGIPTGIRNGKPGVTNINNAFDGDLATFYDRKDAPWIGLDFGEPKQIGEIRYFPRNDHFDVSCWNGTEWQSLGKLNVNSQKLKVPRGTLLRLRDATQAERQGGRVFFFHNGFHQIN
ncbi:MAG: hypothetical protein LBK96_05080 [Prevotellaceae bacterium]|jgi:hypothetical protein|nr:hypothetical protein [Prevotellaceae bacterium]